MRLWVTILMLVIMPCHKILAQWDTARVAHCEAAPWAAGSLLVATGATFTFVPEAKSVAVDLRKGVQSSVDKKMHIDDYVQYLPAVVPLSLSACGIKGRHSIRKMVLLEGGSYLLGSVILFSCKYGFGVQRPDNQVFNSFPSGHTFMAVTGAEVLRREYGEKYPWLAVAGYTVAVFVGFMRIYNDRHWLGDVLAGGGLGIFSVSTVYLLFDK